VKDELYDCPPLTENDRIFGEKVEINKIREYGVDVFPAESVRCNE
jgi:hypothetical protein